MTKTFMYLQSNVLLCKKIYMSLDRCRQENDLFLDLV